MPAAAGTYAIVMRADGGPVLRIGQLGRLRLSRGWYVYVGSAFGPGGVAARVGRHLKPHNKAHWHLDYLIGVTRVREVWFHSDQRDLEHTWAQALLAYPAARVPLTGLGASDCSCRSHLVSLPRLDDVHRLRRCLGVAVWAP